MRTIIIILSILNFYLTLNAQESASSAGSSSILLLRFDPSSRVAGFSGAFCGLADDENALYFNPAGLNNLQSSVLSLNHTEWFKDIRIDNIIFGYDISGKFDLGLGLIHMWMPGIEGKDNLGNPTDYFTVSTSVLNLGFSYSYNRSLNLGVAFKYFHDKLGLYSVSSMAFDAGIYLKTFISGLNIGIVVQNFGPEVLYDVKKQKIPLTSRIGLSYNLNAVNTMLMLDFVKSNDTDVNLNFGIEYIFQKQFSIRAGNIFAPNNLVTPSIGVGFYLNQQYNIYYSFVNYTDLGGTHRLGFAFNFSPPHKKIRSSLIYEDTQPIELIPPENVTVTVSEQELNISWSRLNGVQYNVFARYSSNNKWIKLNKTPLYLNHIEFKKPLAPGKYHFRVSSVYKGKESAYSKEVLLDVN